jgi:hypothetical protein
MMLLIIVAATITILILLGRVAALTMIGPRYRDLRSRYGARRTGYPPAGPAINDWRSAFRTSDWDKPNCQAICDGLTPAMKAARTAFNFPGVK